MTVPPEVFIDDRHERRRMPGGGDATDRLTRRLPHLFRRRAGDRGSPQSPGQRGGVDTVRSAGHHEQRFAIGPENETVGDRPDLDPQRLRGQRRGGGGIREHDDVAGNARCANRVVDEAAAGRKVRGHGSSLRPARHRGGTGVLPPR